MDPVADLIALLAAHGVLALFLIAAFERLLPVIPSHATLVAVGIGASTGTWSFAGAALAIALGSVLGSCALRLLVMRMGERRLRQAARWLGVGPSRFDGLLASYQARPWQWALMGQLTPAVRWLVPGIAGLGGGSVALFVVSTLLGVLGWTLVFMLGGYLAGSFFQGVNASALALQVVLGLLAIEFSLLMAWRAARRRSVGSGGRGHGGLG